MAMTLVSTVTVGSGGAASIEFTNIPQTGKDLLLVASTRTGGTDPDQISFTLQLNNTSKSASRILYGTGSAVASNTTDTFLTNRGGSTSNTFGNHAFYIPNYTSAVSKSVSADGVNENNSSSFAWQTITALTFDGVTTAVTSVKITPDAFTWVQYSSASLYIIS